MALNIEFLDVSGAQIPVKKTYEFEGITYTFRFKKNSIGNFFTIEIYNEIDETFLYSNKLVYGQTITDTLLSPISGDIIPLNIQVLQGNPGTQDINESTLGDSIKIFTNITES